MNQITPKQFLEETGMSRETFDQALRMGILPVGEDGMIDFRRGWNGIADFVEHAEGNSNYASRIAAVQDEVRRKIFARGRTIPDRRESSSSGSEAWQLEGFVSPEGYEAFKKAEANGQIGIFEGRR